VAVETYEQMPYTSKPYRHATSTRMFVIAGMMGVEAEEPSTARVLEIGCAGGGNLIPQAVLHPKANFVGLDPAASHIAEAERARVALGLTNIRFIQAPIEELDPAEGPFDYIISHGVFSWIPEAARHAMLRVCRDRLAANGVAYISYNTLPGWHMRRVARDAMMFHVEAFPDHRERIDQARAMLNFLADVSGPTGPMGQYLEIERENLERYGDYYLFHEHLSPENDPLYFRQFMGMAQQYGLQFLGEAELQGMMTFGLPDEVRGVLEDISNDLLRTQQYLDFVVQRAFRQTLLVHANVGVDRVIQSGRLLDRHAATDLRRPAEGPSPLDPGISLTFVNGEGREFTTDHAVVKAALMALHEVYAGTFPIRQLAEVAAERVREAGFEVADDYPSSVAKAVVLAYARGLAEVWPSAMVCDSGESGKPKTWAYAAMQARQGSPWVTTRRHEAVHVDEFDRQVLLACDGSRDQLAIGEYLREAVLRADLFLESEGTRVPIPQTLQIVDAAYPTKLHVLGRIGLFAPEEAP